MTTAPHHVRRGAAALLLAPILALAWVGAPAGAQPAEDCPEQTQAGLDACAGRAFKAADSDLNETYRTVTSRLATDKASHDLLVAAQRAWITFRDAECTFRTNATAQGTIHSMLVTQCRTDLTLQRTEELQAMLTCEEGDLSCPVPPAP